MRGVGPRWCMLLLINMTLKKSHFRVRFWGGGHQKAYAVYAFINVDNCERPLISNFIFVHYEGTHTGALHGFYINAAVYVLHPLTF